jgi:hypothetical protein
VGVSGYELLGDLTDSKEVAIVMENFVIRGKAFFPRCLRHIRERPGWAG